VRSRLELLPELALAVLVLVSLTPGRADATVVGTIFSGPTSDDPLTVYWNPAAMTLAPGTRAQLYSGATLISMSYDRHDVGTGERYPRADQLVAKPEIAFGFITDLGTDRLRAGLSFATPVLDGVRWDTEYGGQPSSTRYYAIEGHQAHMFIRPAVAYRVHPKISIGVGLDIIGIWLRSDAMVDLGAMLNQAACRMNEWGCSVDAPLPREDPAYAGRLAVDAVGWGVGVAGGVHAVPWPWLRLGLSAASGGREIDVPVRFDVQVPEAARAFVRDNLPSLGLPPLNAEASVGVYSPMMVTAGVMLLPTARIRLAADLHWIQKSRMSVTMIQILQSSSDLITDQVKVAVVRDAFTAGLRGSYLLRPNLAAALRAEYTSNTMPERFTTPVSLDFAKVNLQAGLDWRLTRWLGVVLEYTHTILVPRTIAQSAFAPNADPRTPEQASLDRPYPTGRYRGLAAKLTVGVTLTF